MVSLFESESTFIFSRKRKFIPVEPKIFIAGKD